MRQILVVDDESTVRFGVRDFLQAQGLEVQEADSFAAAEEAVRWSAPDAIVLVDRLPDGDAVDLLPRLKDVDPGVPIVILTDRDASESGPRAIQSGADQFLTRPVQLPTLHVLLQRLLEIRRERQCQTARQSRRGMERNPFLGLSGAIRQLENDARQALRSGRPILIEGEIGTGKSVLAEWLYLHGTRSDEAFVHLGCGGLSRDQIELELFGQQRTVASSGVPNHSGVLEVAHHGTLFLDEIGEMDLAVQAKLVDVIEGRRFRRLGETRDRGLDVQLITASHEDLRSKVAQRRFREDLYDRIGANVLRVPSLRERTQDIPALAAAVLDELSLELGRPRIALAPETEQMLATSTWSGNMRELRNVLERAILRANGGPLERSHLGLLENGRSGAGDDSRLTLAEIERLHIERALQAENGHVERAARRLGMPR